MTDLTGQQEELSIEGVGTCYAHKVNAVTFWSFESSFLVLKSFCSVKDIKVCFLFVY